MQWFHLHSNLVIFKYNIFYINIFTTIYLHSNLVIFKCVEFYRQGIDEKLFTFQSGDIQMISHLYDVWEVVVIYIPIWWYSNKRSLSGCSIYFYNIYIPIWWYSNLATSNAPLNISSLIYIPIWWYSNSADAQSRRKSILFTFQSGDIQIRKR